MRICFDEDGADVRFVISDYLPQYNKVFEQALYSLKNGSYVKRFPKDTSGIEKAKANFAEHAEEMFAQMGNFVEVPWEGALADFADKVNGSGIDWWLTGSCATCIRGVPLRPHDVDIMLNSMDIDKIRHLFADRIVEPIVSTKGWVMDYFGVLFMGARIDLAFDPVDFVDNPHPADFGPFAMRHLEEIEWRGRLIKVPPLDLQLHANRRRGRHDRAALIEDHLRRSHART